MLLKELEGNPHENVEVRFLKLLSLDKFSNGYEYE